MSEKHKAFFAPLLRAGYVVGSADADGNSYGNPASRGGIPPPIFSAQAKYAVEPLFFVAESIGALPALASVSEDAPSQIKSMVGITPLMGIPRGYPLGRLHRRPVRRGHS
jgi:hypothetical protein